MNNETKSVGDANREKDNDGSDDEIDNFIDRGSKDMEEIKLDTESPVQYSRKYVPGRGFHRYDNSLKNLIPIRKKLKDEGGILMDSAGLFSTLSFSWISKYMYKAYGEGLKMEELPAISPHDACDYNAERLELFWTEELAKMGPEKASLVKVAWRFSRTRIIASSFVFSCSIFFSFSSSTLLMRELLEYVQKRNGTFGEGMKWAFLLLLAEFLRMLFFAWAWGLNYRTGMRLRSACCILLYKKIIRLNNFGNTNIGEVINIFSNDAQRIFDVLVFGPMVISGPITTIWGVCYILWIFSPMALLGMIAFLLFYPLQYMISHLVGQLRTKLVKISDMRVRLMNEILDSIKLIKMYAWEKRFNQNLLQIRKREQRLLLKASYYQGLSVSMAPTIPVISAVISFLAHVSAGNNLTAAQAFPLATFYGNQIRQALIRLRDGAQTMVESIVAFRRFKVFPYMSLLDSRLRSALNAFEFSTESIITGVISLNRSKNVLLLKDGHCPISKPILRSQALAISHGTFACNTFDNWNREGASTADKKREDGRKASRDETEKEKLKKLTDSTEQVEVLFDISFEAGKGKLIGICGHVGSGKSSLLLAALGQLRILEGQLSRDGSCAYVSQQAWIINATLRENILFGAPYDHGKYHKAIHASSLIQDIGMMPAGDQTEIGEKGVNLSGGQKQRVALARALYADRDIYFLDDPLSAVDSRVGSDIFDNYILKALSKKTVLFVTHQIQYLSRCDDIYMMKGGKIIAHSTHDELMISSKEYALMVTSIPSDTEAENSTIVEEKIESDTQSSENIRPPVTEKSTRNNSTPKVNKDQVEKSNTQGAALIASDNLEKGTIKVHTYQSYIVAAGGYIFSSFVVLTFVMTVGSTTFSSWWLASWIKAGGGNATVIKNNETTISENINDNPDFSYYQLIYASTVGLIILSSGIRSLVFTHATIGASTNLHNDLFKKIVASPMRFFETTPSGRIQHLFSRDMDEVDTRLPMTLTSFMQNIFVILLAILVICLVFPWFVLPLCLISIAYYFVSKIFRVAVRDLKRMENTSRAPIISFVKATVQGLDTIHAFGKETDFMRKFSELLDKNSQCMFLCCIAMRWLAVRVDSLSAAITCITALLVIMLQGSVPPALAGLALSYSAHISGVLQYTIRLISETELRFISVERINYYLRNLTSEGGVNQSDVVKPPPSWPSVAKISFRNVSMAYGEDCPFVLQNISFAVNAGEKIGIVGRTGSGKTSLTVALFRLVELVEGKIEIDDVDISKISLEQLRTKLSIIPQDPTLFSGTVRSNLDPFELHTDGEIWKALEKTKLKNRVQSIDGHLDAFVGFGGDNLSVGERQLLCLTRALLRDTKILVLDEATASVDLETEIAVQTTIQKEFSHCTILTIAHRLQTVLSLNRVLVMDSGKVLEFDSPTNLLKDENSEFSKMVAAAEQAMSQ